MDSLFQERHRDLAITVHAPKDFDMVAVAAENDSSSPSYGIRVVCSSLPVSPDIQGIFLLFFGPHQTTFAFVSLVPFENLADSTFL